MSKVLRICSAATVAVIACTLSAASAQQPAPTHIIVPADKIAWGLAPPSVPAGARAAILYGDPARDGLFAMRLKAPKDYIIPPHTHPAPEIVTVMSGVVRLGLGTKVNAAGARPLGPGSFYSTEPGTAHFIIVDKDAVVQVNSRGPWGIHYLNPADDPRSRK